MNYLKAEGIDPYQAQEVSTLKGIGVSGTVEGHQVILANQKEIERRALSFDQEKLKEYQAQGNTISFLLIDEELVAFFAMGDSIKPQAKAFIKDLRNAGIEPVMLTGDNQEAAKSSG